MREALKIYSRVILFLFPIFFLPVLLEPYGFGKVWFLVVSGMIGLLIWVADMLLGKKNEIKVSGILWAMGLLVGWAVLSWSRLPEGVRMKSLMSPMGLGALIGILLWVFIWLQIGGEKEGERQFKFLTAGGVVAGLLSLVTFLLPASRLPISIPSSENPLVVISSAWSVTGSLYLEIILMTFLAIGWIGKLLTRIKTNKGYIIQAVVSAFLVLVLSLGVYRMIKSGWVVMDRSSAWVIAVDTLKVKPLTGVGLGNYIQAFNFYRPASYNASKYWSTAFNSAPLGVLGVWTELGVVGLILAVWFLGSLLRSKKGKGQVGLVVLFSLAVLFLPLNIMTLFLLFWLLTGSVVEPKESKMILNMGENNFNILPLIVGVLLTVGTIFGGYWWGKILMGEVYMRSSLVAAAQNNGGLTYDMQIKAIGMNPYHIDYRRIYSQTNLALAKSLLAKEEVGDEDKQKASVLIQQAVREGQATIALNNLDAVGWTNLATIYKDLIGVVDGAADWSLQAYDQAVALDPVNPMLRLDLGGLLFAANRMEEADRVFEQVVSNKSDFANGWYNWAHTAKNMNRLADAVTRLNQALTLVPVDSGDYENASKLLAEWRKELDEAIKQQQALMQQQQQEKQPETLKTPEPLPTASEEEMIDIPAEDLEPPIPEIIPEEEVGEGEVETPTESVSEGVENP